MLETIREYALEQLTLTEEEVLRAQHARYFTELAVAGEAAVWGAHEQAWFARLEAEHDNVRMALRWLVEQQDAEAALRLSGAMGAFWRARNYHREGRSWLQEALAIDAVVPAAARVSALDHAGWMAVVDEDATLARTCFTELLALGRELGDVWSIGNSLRGLGSVAMITCKYQHAAARFQESLVQSRNGGDLLGVGFSLRHLAELAQLEGDDVRNIVLREEAVAAFREAGFTGGVAALLEELGQIAQATGDDARASGLYRESLTLYRSVGWIYVIHDALLGLAGVAANKGQVARATRLLAAVAALRKTRSSPMEQATLPEYASRVVDVRSRLAKETFDAAWTAGETMSLEQAVEYALTDASDYE